MSQATDSSNLDSPRPAQAQGSAKTQVAKASAAEIIGEVHWREFPEVDLDDFLTSALHRIVERGYYATSVRTIVKDVGVTIPAFYYHYENKQQMLVALLDLSMDIVQSKIGASVEEAGEDVVKQLTNFAECTALIMAYYREFAFLDSEIRSLERENLEHYARRRDRTEALLREIVTRGCGQGKFHTPYPLEAARALLTSLQGIALWFRMDGPDTPEDIAQHYAHFALAIVQADTRP